MLIINKNKHRICIYNTGLYGMYTYVYKHLNTSANFPYDTMNDRNKNRLESQDVRRDQEIVHCCEQISGIRISPTNGKYTAAHPYIHQSIKILLREQLPMAM